MAYEVQHRDLGYDATPDWDNTTVPKLVGKPLAAIAHKAYPEPSRWTIVGWRYIGTDGWADVDSDGVCYAVGKAYFPPQAIEG